MSQIRKSNFQFVDYLPNELDILCIQYLGTSDIQSFLKCRENEDAIVRLISNATPTVFTPQVIERIIFGPISTMFSVFSNELLRILCRRNTVSSSSQRKEEETASSRQCLVETILNTDESFFRYFILYPLFKQGNLDALLLLKSELNLDASYLNDSKYAILKFVIENGHSNVLRCLKYEFKFELKDVTSNEFCGHGSPGPIRCRYSLLLPAGPLGRRGCR